MIKNFPEWFSHAVKGADPDKIERRLKALAALKEDVSELTPQGMANLAIGAFDDEDETVNSEFKQPFRDADPTYALRKNKVEVRILASSLMAALIEDESSHDEWLDHTANLFCSALHLQKLEAPWLEFFTIASSYLNERAEALRGSTSLRRSQPSDLAPLLKEITTQFTSNQHAQLAASVPKALTTLHNDLGRVFHCHNRLSEESNMLWWLTGEFSSTLKLPLNKVRWLEAVYPSAYELIKLTPFRLATRNAPQILSKFLQAAKGEPPAKLTPSGLIEKCNLDWAKHVLLKDSLASEIEDEPELYPLTYGLLMRTKLRNNWTAPASEESGLDLNLEIDETLCLRQVILEMNALDIGEFIDG